MVSGYICCYVASYGDDNNMFEYYDDLSFKSSQLFIMYKINILFKLKENKYTYITCILCI